MIGLPQGSDWTPDTLAELYKLYYLPKLTTDGFPTPPVGMDSVLDQIAPHPLSTWLLADFAAYALNRYISESEDPTSLDIPATSESFVDAVTLSATGYADSVQVMMRLDAVRLGPQRSEVLTDISLVLALRESTSRPRGFEQWNV